MLRSARYQLMSVVLLCVLAGEVVADVRLPAILGDHMVLQRGTPARLWGWAEAGERVAVSGSWESAPVETTADDAGHWRIDLALPEDVGPHTITFQAGNTLTLDDVLVGEVWVCSGQSNMEMRLKGGLPVNNADAEVAAAKYPQMRLFTVQKAVDIAPRDDVEGRWQVCAPETVGDFSAVGYFFGRELHQELDVPIGLVCSAWGGTRAEAWTSRDKLAELGAYADELAVEYLPATEENLARHQQALRQWEQHRDALAKSLGADERAYATAEFDDAAWLSMELPGAWEDLGDEMHIDGVVWFRKTIDIPPAWAGSEMTLCLGAIDDGDMTFFNGRQVGALDPLAPGAWTQQRRYPVPAELVRGGAAVIAVRVMDTGGAGGFSGEPAGMRLERANGDALALAGLWRYHVAKALEPVDSPLVHRHSPAALYNAMIAPLLNLRMRGAIWYQGESNHERGRAYRALFPAMISCWRDAWAQGDFPFYYVQIAPYRYGTADSSAWLREAQLMTLTLPHTGMAVITDISEVHDIHPRNKQDVGKRLAAWALAKDYGRERPYSGPLYREMKIEDGAIRILFDYADGGLVARDGAPTEFTIAGEERDFYPAEARIDGDTVVVSNPRVLTPVAVRFGWSNTPTPNLFNKAGLPASPFRTDSWRRGTGLAPPDRE